MPGNDRSMYIFGITFIVCSLYTLYMLLVNFICISFFISPILVLLYTMYIKDSGRNIEYPYTKWLKIMFFMLFKSVSLFTFVSAFFFCNVWKSQYLSYRCHYILPWNIDPGMKILCNILNPGSIFDPHEMLNRGWK